MSDDRILPSVDVFQMVVYIPTFILGLLFNIMALWMVFFKIRKWMESTTYLVCLITLDTVLLVTLPFKISAYNLGEKWELGSTFCSFLESLYFVNMYGSILISVCICVDRYIAIRWPFSSRSLRSPRKATLVCAVVCLAVWAASSSSVYKLHGEEKNNETQCFYGFSNATWTKVSLVTMLETVFVSSALITVFCTAEIVMTLRKNAASGNAMVATSRSVKVVVANLATFLVCFTPFHLSILLYYFVKNGILTFSYEQIRVFVQVSLCVANLNCCLDAICYYLVFKEFLKSVPRETAGVNLEIAN